MLGLKDHLLCVRATLTLLLKWKSSHRQCVNEWAQLCSKETSSTELKCEFHTIFLFDSFFQPFKNVKIIFSSCTRYKKWWYGFGLPAPCSKRWVAAALHSLMDGKSLPPPPIPRPSYLSIDNDQQPALRTRSVNRMGMLLQLLLHFIRNKR